MPAASDDERVVERAADAGKLRVRHRADPRQRALGLDLEREAVAAVAVPALERDPTRRMGRCDPEAGQRFAGAGLELATAPALLAAEEPREPERPGPVERFAKSVRQRSPDFLGRRGRGDFVRVQVRDRRGIRAQAASTTIVDPCPPPMQADAKPSFAPRRFIS
jgi:hypothetical protein